MNYGQQICNVCASDTEAPTATFTPRFGLIFEVTRGKCKIQFSAKSGAPLVTAAHKELQCTHQKLGHSDLLYWVLSRHRKKRMGA